MKKKMISVIAVITLALMLCAYGSKTLFRCAVCMKQVNQVTKQITVLGQDVEVCKSCYSQLKK